MKRLLLLLVAICLLLLCGGCNGQRDATGGVSKKGDDENVTLTFFGNKYEKENVIVIEEILKGFMEENPNISVHYESINGIAYYDALLKRMKSGNGDDVFFIDHDSLLVLRSEGLLEDLSSLPIVTQCTDRVRSQILEKDGKVHMVPMAVSLFGLYCNLDVLKANGFTVPRTLREFTAQCEYFVHLGIKPLIVNNDISLKTLATGVGFYDVYQANRASEVFDRINRGEEKLSTYLAPGYELAENFIKRGYIDAPVAAKTKKTEDDLIQFERGEAPFMLTGSWVAVTVKLARPGLHFEVCPLPFLNDGPMVVVNADTRLAVNAKSKHKDAALKLVEYCTRAQNISCYVNQQYSLSPLKNAEPPTEKEIFPLAETFNAERVVIGSDTRLTLPIWEMGRQASQMLLDGKSAKEVMSWLDGQK